MGQLPYLVDEICAGLEIYFTGRTGGQYLKTAFILCDDYSELTSKLFLLTDNARWSDTHDKEARKYEVAQKAVEDSLNKGTPPAQADLERLAKGAGKDRFKNYHTILSDVQQVFQTKRVTELPKIQVLHNSMKVRRERRNGFFHSAHLLDLNVTQRI